ncbi:hypothetical protein DE146DRAFT_440794 [Phaeosphaeria sp. MPI-PUGE-AT-0046c]|nr:hypothetical protein DE146DRAFT_440794 [Phaeosphaeria sp. MPI-PUGE-AT-0046c]
MSMFDEQPYQHFTHQLFVDPNAYSLGQYDTGRDKTPTDSLINHTGLSPIPLTATPPYSRHASRQPEPSQEQLFDHMSWDDGSSSNSPTSVKTPDGESFDADMLDPDQHDIYSEAMTMSTQVSHNVIPAVDQNIMFTSQNRISDHVLSAALDQAMASHAHEYQAQYLNQTPQMGHFQPQQQQQQHYHHNSFNSTYTTQPAQHGPWNGQGPSRSSTIPRTGCVIFDPMTDPVPFTASNNHNAVESWAMDYTSPSYLVSPSEQESIFDNINPQQGGPHTLVHRPPISIPQQQFTNVSPTEGSWSRPSPSADQSNFINYDENSSIFTESYVTDYRPSPSSPGNSSFGQYPQSPYHQIISPSAASPGSSDGFSPYRPDPAMPIDTFQAQLFQQVPPHLPSALEGNNTHAPTTRTVKFELISKPASATSPSTTKSPGKNGGRAPGTHLEPDVAKAAHDMRKISACWHCVLQRDKCGAGDPCERCLKRSMRPNADCGLGCTRIKLVELSSSFLPGLVTQLHEDSQLKYFVNQHVHSWGNVEFTLYMTCGGQSMPRIPVKVYEFMPNGNELLVQIQYVTDPKTHKRIAINKQSPALGMVHINHNEEKVYDRYISDIVDNHLDAFGKLCWMEDDNDFLPKLFKLMTRVKPKNDDEGKLLREVFRLIVVTFIMSHTLTIAEENKHSTLSRMRSYGGHNAYTDNFTSPRMTNRQLKYFFSRLQRSISALVLNKLQQIFKSSKGCDKWLPAFIAVVGMCMALEDQQKTIHLVMSTRSSTEGLDPYDAQAQADAACREIDNRMTFVMQIFRWKYNRKHNPILNADQDWEKEAGFGDKGSVEFVRQVAVLVKENTDYLRRQQRVSISSQNQGQYSARLVGEFLLSFWLPNAS